jgi:hypothetical protein
VHDEQDRRRPRRRGWRTWATGAALVGSGLLAGGVLATAVTAGADTATPSAESSQSAGGAVDESRSRRPDEQLLTGDTATKVREAALAKYPGATIQRVETDSDGVYEAHLVTADGERVTVEVGKDFAVTGTESHPGHGRPRPEEGGATPQTS